jgi:hypothetical protein
MRLTIITLLTLTALTSCGGDSEQVGLICPAAYRAAQDGQMVPAEDTAWFTENCR